MPFSYEYDVYLAGQRLTPITKRQDVRLGLIECISEPIQSARDNFFDSYIEGDSAADWSNVTAYVRYDRVNYQNRIYECLEDNTGQTPTDEDYWVQVVADFRGARERIKYNCQTLMLEWVMNKWFATTFRQPSTGLPSDFYIENLVRDSITFSVAEESELDNVFHTSEVPEFSSMAEDYVGEESSYTTGYNFNVYYPATEIPDVTDDKYFQMTSIVNQYKIFGSTVNYISY